MSMRQIVTFCPPDRNQTRDASSSSAVRFISLNSLGERGGSGPSFFTRFNTTLKSVSQSHHCPAYSSLSASPSLQANSLYCDLTASSSRRRPRGAKKIKSYL